MTVAELRKRMSALELSGWIVYFQVLQEEVETGGQYTSAINRLRGL